MPKVQIFIKFLYVLPNSDCKFTFIIVYDSS